MNSNHAYPRSRPHVATQHVGRRAAAALVSLALLTGCAALQPKTPEQVVSERAQARWEAILAGDVESGYPYYSPGYRSSVSRQDLARRLANQRVRWTGAALRDVSCREQVCEAVFDVDFSYRVPLRGVGTVSHTSDVTEQWILADGQWYYVPPDLAGAGLR